MELGMISVCRYSNSSWLFLLDHENKLGSYSDICSLSIGMQQETYRLAMEVKLITYFVWCE